MAEIETVATDVAPLPLSRTLAAGAADETVVDELSCLIQKATLARRFIEMHKHAARQCLRAARVAGRNGDHDAMARFRDEAREEHLQAQCCRRYARDCESRAEALGVEAGAYAAAGRSMRLR